MAKHCTKKGTVYSAARGKRVKVCKAFSGTSSTRKRRKSK